MSSTNSIARTRATPAELSSHVYARSKDYVLYRGEVVEKGDVESVIRNPQHAYTQLLVDSIPWPNLNQRWGQHTDLSHAPVEIK